MAVVRIREIETGGDGFPSGDIGVCERGRHRVQSPTDPGRVNIGTDSTDGIEDFVQDAV
jgi:hypothetical protein